MTSQHRDSQTGRYTGVPVWNPHYADEYPTSGYQDSDPSDGVPLGSGPENAPGPGSGRDDDPSRF
jgi:hypothetical protein